MQASVSGGSSFSFSDKKRFGARQEVRQDEARKIKVELAAAPKRGDGLEYELTPINEQIVALASELEEECEDLEDDVCDLEGELVQIYNDIAQDKLDCKYYEDSLGEKEIAMANRVEEVQVMEKENDMREVELLAREDELEEREAVLYGGVLASDCADHKGKLCDVKAAIDVHVDVDVKTLGEMGMQHWKLLCRKGWAETKIAWTNANPESGDTEDAIKEHQKKLEKKTHKVKVGLKTLEAQQERHGQLAAKLKLPPDQQRRARGVCAHVLGDLSDSSDNDST